MRFKSLRGSFVAASTAFLLAGGAMALVASPALAETTTQSSAGEVIDDSVLTTKVKAAFVEDSQVSALRIKVTSSGGIVQLSGFANSPEEAKRAAAIARGVSGVRDVTNDILVRPPAR